MRPRALSVALALATLATACSSNTPNLLQPTETAQQSTTTTDTSTTTTTAAAFAPLALRWAEEQPEEQDASLEGWIEIVDGCLIIDDVASPYIGLPVLPPGYDTSPLGVLVPDGPVLAVGDYIRGAGGFVAPDQAELGDDVEPIGDGELDTCLDLVDYVCRFNSTLNVVRAPEPPDLGPCAVLSSLSTGLFIEVPPDDPASLLDRFGPLLTGAIVAHDEFEAARSRFLGDLRSGIIPTDSLPELLRVLAEACDQL